MAEVLCAATLPPGLRRMIFQPLDGLNPIERQRVEELRATYVVAKHRQRLGLIKRYGKERLRQCEHGTKTIAQCGHGLSHGYDLQARAYWWQHGPNPEHRLVMTSDELGEWPYADGPVGRWLIKLHREERHAARHK